MEKLKNSSVWTEEGYRLFSREGLDGIQVERLARILGLNKSGFYHYFGDLEGFCSELVSLHKKKVGNFLQEVAETKKLDPDYLYLLIKYSETVIFQVQLTRSLNHLFSEASRWVDQKVDTAIRRLWSDFIEVPNDSDGGMRYYAIVRDMFYTRISFQNLNYTFLHNLVKDAKAIMNEISELRALEADESLY
jgi:AcrR family transcriptional regulator